LSRIVDELVCPECGCKDFLVGPRGGLSVNIKCANCGYWMSVTAIPFGKLRGKIWITDERRA